MQLRFALTWLFACLVLSCGGTPDRAPESAASPPAKAKSAPSSADTEAEPGVVKRPPRDGAPIIRLLTAGSEPRAPLRYTPVAKAREPVVMIMKMSLAMGAPDVPGEPIALPTTSMNMNLVIDGVDASGNIDYRFILESIDVETGKHPSQLTDQIESATSKLVGMNGRVRMTARGVVERMEMRVPGGVDPATKELMAEMERSMRQMCDPLPEEAVGAGARWDVHTRYTLRGIDVDQVRRYTLVERQDKVFSMKYIVEQTARPQSLKLPNVPAGATVRLEQLASAGDGKVQLEVAHLAPRSSTMAMRTTSVVNVRAEGQSQTVRTDMDIEVSLSPSSRAKK